MRKAIIIIFLGMAPLYYCFSQPPIPPFRYVSVETIDYSGVKDIFQVSLYTRKWVVENGYHIISDNKSYWPEDAKADSCQVITVKLHTHDRYKGKYKTSLYLVGCGQDTVFQSEGKSMGPTDAEGFQNAAFEALKELKKALLAGNETADRGRRSN